VDRTTQRTTESSALALATGLTAAAALIVLALLAAPGMARAATYKWVDEKGVVHYTDHMPQEAVNKGNAELNKQGVTVKTTEPAPTPEQRRAKEEEEARQRDIVRQQEERARRDRALLSSYTSEAEIDLARNRSLRTIESVVQSSKAYTEQLTRRKKELDAKKKTEFATKPMPPTMERELETINTELAKQDDLLFLKQQEVVAVKAKYDADKKRWRELVAAKGGEAAALADVNALPPPPEPPAPKAAAAKKK
jgi:Domain of unknown function (DUF4124)